MIHSWNCPDCGRLNRSSVCPDCGRRAPIAKKKKREPVTVRGLDGEVRILNRSAATMKRKSMVQTGWRDKILQNRAKAAEIRKNAVNAAEAAQEKAEANL